MFLFWDVAWCKLVVVTNHNFISKFVLSRKLGLSQGGKTRLRVFDNWVFKTVFGLRREKVNVNSFIHSFSCLSYNRSKASSKASSPHSAI